MGQSRTSNHRVRLTPLWELGLETFEYEGGSVPPAPPHLVEEMTDYTEDVTGEELEPAITVAMAAGYDTFEAVTFDTTEGIQVIIWPMRLEALLN